MDRKQVESSQIKSVGYDPAARKMHIEFINHRDTEAEGSVYEYDNVEQEVYDGFFVEKEEDGTPRSIGRYFGRTIKNNAEKYPYKKLAPAAKS